MSVNDSCLICGSLSRSVFHSSANTSVTSLAALLPGRTVVSLCEVCGHLQTASLVDLEVYYDSNYKINALDIDDDDLYSFENGSPVFRSMHQARVFVDKMGSFNLKKVLDYGCGKSFSARQAMVLDSELDFHLYDVSRDYEHYWRTYRESEKLAFFETPISWDGYFDCVTSFFSLEHVPFPLTSLAALRKLLKVGGFLYATVPNIYSVNRSDLLVVDHLQHYAPSSMKLALELSGFELMSVDHHSHQQASIYIAKSIGVCSVAHAPDSEQVKLVVADVKLLVDYWKGVEARLAQFERRVVEAGCSKLYIFGAGVVGVHLYSKFVKKGMIAGFVDSNRNKQKKTYCGLPVYSPDILDLENSDGLLVGLNSGIGESLIGAMRQFDAIRGNIFFC